MSKNSEAILHNSATRFEVDEREIAYDLVFVINANSKGWILEKICRVVDQYSDLHCAYVFSERNDSLTVELPKAKAYFFAHYALAYWTLVKHRQVFAADRFLYFTHPDANKGISFDELATALNSLTHVFAMNTELKKLLSLIGVRREKLSVPIGGADPQLFLPHKRGGGKVGFVSAYYPRKMPDKMLDIIRAMPDIEFLLVGPPPNSVANQGILWCSWSRFDELCELPNLTYLEAEYEEYPSLFAQMDVYVSLSRLEGGPIPVLEAMMANVVPVATRTGFAEDVIDHGKNGYVVEVDSDIAEVGATIRQALDDTETDIRSSALEFTWEKVAQHILRYVQEPAISGRTISLAGADTPKTIFRDGWHSPEPNGTWTSKPVSELSLRLRQLRPGRKLIVLNAWTVLQPPDNRTTVRVRVNGEVVIDEALTTSSPTELRGEFELGPQEADLALAVTIEVSPVLQSQHSGEGEQKAAARGGSSQRSVGIKVGWVRIDDYIAVQLASGEEIGFGADKPGVSLLQDGWYPVEPDGAWTEGRTGSISLPPTDATMAKGARLLIDGRVLAAGTCGATRLTVSVVPSSGEPSKVAEVEFGDENFKSFSVPLEGIAATDGGGLTLVFESSNSIRPAEIHPDSKDHRELGFFLRSLRLEQARTWGILGFRNSTAAHSQR